MILKEGYLCKKGGVIKSWSRRYFVLNHQCLCYFKRALNSAEADSGLQPLGRVFLSDIVDIETEGVEKKRAFVFSLNTKKRGVLLQASNYDDKEKWVDAVRQAAEGAALMTGARLEVEPFYPFYQNVLPNAVLARTFRANAATVGMKLDAPIAGRRGSGASTDFGNVSQTRPSFELRYAVSETPVPSHSREMCETAITETAFSNAISVAKILTLTACDFLSDPALLQEAQADFAQRSG